MTLDETLAPYRALWSLAPEGPAFETNSSVLQSVRLAGRPAMLKFLKNDDDEARGPAALGYFAGQGAVELFAAEGLAHVTARAIPGGDLVAMSDTDDDGALLLICDALEALHAPRALTIPPLIPLRTRFRTLFRMRSDHPLLEAGAVMAEALLADPRDERVLHGDMHHTNVVFDEARGWLAIDPKGVFGERAYDYANSLFNPTRAHAHQPGRLERQAEIVSARTGIPKSRVLAFAFAHIALSTAWSIEDSHPFDMDLIARAQAAYETARTSEV
jgi:streptomycin 6-kinase